MKLSEPQSESKPDHYKPDHYKPDHYKPDHYKPDHYKPDHYKPDHYKPDHYKPDHYKPDHYKPDHYKPDHYTAIPPGAIPSVPTCDGCVLSAAPLEKVKVIHSHLPLIQRPDSWLILGRCLSISWTDTTADKGKVGSHSNGKELSTLLLAIRHIHERWKDLVLRLTIKRATPQTNMC